MKNKKATLLVFVALLVCSSVFSQYFFADDDIPLFSETPSQESISFISGSSVSPSSLSDITLNQPSVPAASSASVPSAPTEIGSEENRCRNATIQNGSTTIRNIRKTGSLKVET